ncbi:MAG: hypothetical protein FWD14_07830 [Treponema sp.]|nr:hypothetical protein [Treponema sp.]
MNKTAVPKTLKNQLPFALAVFFFLFTLFPIQAQTAAGRAPIDVNLIIDGSASLSNVKDEITTWISSRLDQILVDGDRITVWNAGTAARVIYSGRIDADEKEAVKRSIRDISPSGNNPDFTSALREAAGRQSSGYSYTLLISASPAALSSVISNPQGNLLRFSRVEEFTSWRALVVGLNLDSRVRRAASAYFEN